MFYSVVASGCPDVTGQIGSCVELCNADNCPVGHMCCSNGCGHECMPVGLGKTHYICVLCSNDYEHEYMPEDLS